MYNAQSIAEPSHGKKPRAETKKDKNIIQQQQYQQHWRKNQVYNAQSIAEP